MRWFKPARQNTIRNNDRLRPHLEALEAREVPAGLFLQGQSFLDVNQNGTRDANESGLSGATVELRSQDGSTLIATTTINDPSGTWRFDDTNVTGGLLAGTYRVVQVAPTGFASNAASADLWKLGGATVLNASAIQVVLADSVANPLTLTYPSTGDYRELALTLTNPYSVYDLNKDGKFFAFSGELNITLSGGNFASATPFITYCLDLTNELPTTPATATVVPRSEPVAPTLTENAGRIAYLYNHHGIGGFSGINAALDAAALQVALWELCYDTGVGNLAAGNFVFRAVRGQSDFSTDADSSYIRSKATSFLSESMGKDELAVYLDGPATKTQLTIIGGSLNFGNVAEAKIGDFVWEDVNGNGVQDGGESGIADVTVNLLSGTTVIATTTTGANGYYQFDGLAPGAYAVQFVAPSGYTFTTANAGSDDAKDSDANPADGTTGSYTLASGEYNDTVDAGLFRLATLGDFVWEDVNGNGVQDGGESGIADVTVNLLSGTTVIATTTTGANGYYQFDGLAPGAYAVQFVAPSGYTFTTANAGSDDAKDSDANASTGTTGTYTLASGEYNDTVDAGLFRLATLGDFVWEDVNGNGVQDDGNTGIDGVVLELYDTTSGSTIATTATATHAGAKGYYQFANLRPGAYGVRVATSNFNTGSPLNGFTPTESMAWAVAVDNDSNDPTGTTTTLASGGSDQTLDFGFLRPAALGDFVWEDANKNGVQDSGESGIAGVVVLLLDEYGNSVLGQDGNPLTATTDANGYYKFTDLAPGSYRVRFVVPGTYALTTANVGNDALDSDADANGLTGVYTLQSGQEDLTVDAGMYLKQDTTCYTISGYKFYDRNADGVWDRDGLDNVLGTCDDEIGLSGWRIYVDSNHNGRYDCGERSDVTNCSGYYEIDCVPAGTYVVREVMQCGWVRTTDENVVVVLQNGQSASNVNFGNFKGDLVMSGDTATIGFWQNKNGQALIRSLNGSKYSTKLGNWLASNFGNMYGQLAGKSNDYVANYFVTLFKQTGMKLGAQVLATALAVYVTDSDLAGGMYASRYGFTVNTAGIAKNYYNIGDTGAAFGVADDSALTVMDILKRTNARYTARGFWDGNSALQVFGNLVFTGINEQGDIT